MPRITARHLAAAATAMTIVGLLWWAWPHLFVHAGEGVDQASSRETTPAAVRDRAAAGRHERSDPPGSRRHATLRHHMVLTQMARPVDGRRPVTNDAVLRAMGIVPRHAFVPDGYAGLAYADTPLPIGHGQTISQPYVVAMMTELLQLTVDSKVLEIGTGSGYQAAVLAHLTPHVYTVEIIDPLAKKADEALGQEGYDEVRRRCADGYFGWPEQAPFDAIIVTCASGHLPPSLWQQLKPGGRIVIPIGGPHEVQRLVVMFKTPEGTRQSRAVTSVRFVPMTRSGGGGP